MDDVAHDRRVVVKFWTASFAALTVPNTTLSNSEMLFILRMYKFPPPQYREPLAHVGEESLSDVVVEFGERNLLGARDRCNTHRSEENKAILETERLFVVTQNVILHPRLLE